MTTPDIYRVTFSASVTVLAENEQEAKEKAVGLLFFTMAEEGFEKVFTLEDCRIEPPPT